LFTGEVSVKKVWAGWNCLYDWRESQSWLCELVYFMALLSLNLAIINNATSSGTGWRTAVVYHCKKIAAKPSDDMEGRYIFRIMLLFGLMIYVTWNDIIVYFFFNNHK
jgi:membrane-associated protease RseP (regulator of RpoE activity)